MARLEGRVAIVSGAGRGIGAEIALLLAAEGASVVVNDLDREAADETVDRIVQGGGQADACPGNVTAADFPDQLAILVRERHGDVHIVVNNAGYVWNDPLHRTSDEQWDAMQAVHLKAPFRLLRALHPLIRERSKAEAATGAALSRKVVNVASIAATRGAAGQAAYSAAKAGLFGLTRSLAKEWGPMNVTVNCVAFGLVDTRLTRAIERDGDEAIDVAGASRRVGFRPEQREAIIGTIPLGRSASPREAAGGAFIFCLPEANYITGQCIEVAGGIAY